jgi:hypothetical protein
MKRFLMVTVVMGICSLLSFSAMAAESQTNNTVNMVGVDGSDGRVFVSVSGYSSGSCSYFRFLPGNTDTDKILTVLTAAKLSGKKVRIDTISSNCDTGYRAYIQ